MKSKITKYINIELFYKIYNPLRFICFSIVNNCKPLPINKEFLNTEYKVFISKNNNEIYKILRKDSFWSWVIANEIKTQKGYENYKSELLNSAQLPFLNKHIAKVNKVYRNGRYDSEYIKGKNVKELLFNLNALSLSYKNELKAAIEQLIRALEKFEQKENKLIGDWHAQNLIYDEKSQIIKNVDLGGFRSSAHKGEASSNFLKKEMVPIFE